MLDPMHMTRNVVCIVSNLGTRDLEAWLGSAHLWSTPPTDPGSADEVAEFYVETLIRLLVVVEGMSAHQRMELCARMAEVSREPENVAAGGLLGAFPAPRRQRRGS